MLPCARWNKKKHSTQTFENLLSKKCVKIMWPSGLPSSSGVLAPDLSASWGHGSEVVLESKLVWSRLYNETQYGCESHCWLMDSQEARRRRAPKWETEDNHSVVQVCVLNFILIKTTILVLILIVTLFLVIFLRSPEEPKCTCMIVLHNSY